MPARTLPGLNLRAFYSLGESGWNTTLDEDLRKLSALVPAVVLSRVTSLPDTPANGDIHILTAEDSNSGPAGSIIYYENGAWVYFTPSEGWEYYSIADAGKYRYTGGTWIALGGDSIDALDVTYSSGTTGDSNSTEVNVADALDDLYERVRGVGGATHIGAFWSNEVGTVLHTTLASVGMHFLPAEDIDVAGVGALITAGSSGETFKVSIWTVASLGANLGTEVASATVPALVASGAQQIMGIFSAPVTLTAGQLYVLIVTRTDATGTDSNRVRRSEQDGFYFTLRGHTYTTSHAYATNNPTAGQASGASSLVAVNLFPIVSV